MGLFSLCLWLAAPLVAAPLLSFDFDAPGAATIWRHKANTTVTITEETPQAGRGALRWTVAPTEFSYGWVHAELPEADYGALHGILGYYRASPGATGRLLLHLCLRGDTPAEMSYFRADVGALGDSQGTWIPFYVRIRDLRHEKGPVETLRPSAIRPGDLVQFLASVEDKKTVVLDVDSVAFLPAADGVEVARRVKALARTRLLVPESRVAGPPHPRLFFTKDWLPRYRSQAAAGGEIQAAYRRLLQVAEQLLSTYDAENPLGKLDDFVAATRLEGTPWRAAFERRLVAASWPLEVLGAAYQLTGDQRFGEFGAKALVHAARGLTVDEPFLDRGFYYTRTFYVRALAFGYDWLWDRLTPADRRAVKSTLLGFVIQIHEQSQTAGWGRRPLHRVWNWDPGLMGACGVGMLALEGETKLGEKGILFDCRRHLRDYLTLGIDSDGCGHEGPNYLGYGIGAGVEFVELLRRQGRGDLFTETNLRLIPPWLIAETLPDGRRWNNLSDCGHGQRAYPVYLYACGRLAELARTGPPVAGERWWSVELQKPLDYLQQFAETPGPPRLSYTALAGLMGWAWRHGPGRFAPDQYDGRTALAHVLLYHPCSPVADPGKYLPSALHFRGRGLVVCRTGFGPDDFHLAVEAGPHAAGHDQSDKGTFTLSAYGADLVIDSGYGNDGDPGKSGSSFAHNVVLIDHRGQPMHFHNQSSGRVTGFHHSALLDWIRIDAREAWSVRYDRDLVPHPTFPVQRAERTFLFVRPRDRVPGYLVVYDDLVKDTARHDYTWQWHIPASRKFLVSPTVWSAVSRGQDQPVLTTAATGTTGSALFRFTVSRAGRYVLYGLCRAGGRESGKSDSFFVSVDGGHRLTWDLKTGTVMGWTPLNDRGEDQPRVFAFAAGEHEVEVTVRERQAELARLLVLPAGSAPPADPESTPSGALSLKPARAELKGKGFRIRPPAPPPGPQVTLEVFPVHPTGGTVRTDWFLTSRERAHPRLQYTVHTTAPRFVMVLVPRRGHVSRPAVTRLSGPDAVGAKVQFAGTTDLIVFSRTTGRAGDVALQGSAGFVRVARGRPLSWALLDGRRLSYTGRTLVARSKPEVVVRDE